MRFQNTVVSPLTISLIGLFHTFQAHRTCTCRSEYNPFLDMLSTTTFGNGFKNGYHREWCRDKENSTSSAEEFLEQTFVHVMNLVYRRYLGMSFYLFRVWFPGLLRHLEIS